MEKIRPNLDKIHRCPRCHSIPYNVDFVRLFRYYTCGRCQVKWLNRPYFTHIWWRTNRRFSDLTYFCKRRFVLEVDTSSWNFFLSLVVTKEIIELGVLCFYLIYTRSWRVVYTRIKEYENGT